METTGSTEYFPEIVYLRALAILAVISIHVSTVFYEMDGTGFLAFLYMSVYTFSDVAVPLFICISGFVLYNRYRGSYSLQKFYTKRFLAVVPQYTIFSLFAILFVYTGSLYLGQGLEFYLRLISFTSTGTGDTFYYFWFFILIIQLYILYPLLEKMFTNHCRKTGGTRFPGFFTGRPGTLFRVFCQKYWKCHCFSGVHFLLCPGNVCQTPLSEI